MIRAENAAFAEGAKSSAFTEAKTFADEKPLFKDVTAGTRTSRIRKTDHGVTMKDETERTLQLDNEMGFALYACSKELIRKYAPVLERLDLTYTSYLAMLALWERDGVCVTDLGKRLYLDSGTLTPLLKKMERQGLVERRRDAEDERTVRIFLTAKGRSLRDRAQPLLSALHRTLSLPDTGLFAQLKTLLSRLYR